MISKRLLFLLALFLCCAAPTAAGVIIGGGPHHKGPQGTCCPKVKDEARIPTEPMPVRVVPVTKYRLDPPQQKASLAELVRAPWPCEQIRKAVEHFGKDAVRKYARDRGYTKKQIDEAMACLTEKKT